MACRPLLRDYSIDPWINHWLFLVIYSIETLQRGCVNMAADMTRPLWQAFPQIDESSIEFTGG